MRRARSEDGYVGDDLYYYSDDPVISREVIADDGTPQFTGLYDADGAPIYRVVPRFEVGFRGPSRA